MTDALHSLVAELLAVGTDHWRSISGIPESAWETKMIPRRTCHSSIQQSWMSSRTSRSRIDIWLNASLQPKSRIRFPSSSHAFLSALAHRHSSFRALLCISLSERRLTRRSGNCIVGSGDKFPTFPHEYSTNRVHQHDRRLARTVVAINILKDHRCNRGYSFQETSQKAVFSSESSNNESKRKEIREPPAHKASLSEENARVNPQILKDPVPPPISNYVVLQHWLEQLKSPPNMITASRILIIPFISYWIITQQTVPAIIGCIYAALSDVLDGHLARRYPHMQTALGTYLDPLADKLLINALSISLWIHGTIPGALMALWLVRDVFLMVATHRYVAQNTAPGMAVMDPVTVPLKVTPTTISKVNTALQFVTLTVGIIDLVPHEMAATDVVLPPDNDWIAVQLYMSETILPALCWITGTTTILSFFSYWGHSAFAAAVSSKNMPHTTK